MKYLDNIYCQLKAVYTKIPYLTNNIYESLIQNKPLNNFEV